MKAYDVAYLMQFLLLFVFPFAHDTYESLFTPLVSSHPLSARLPVSHEMAKAATPTLNVALNLEVPGSFTSTGPKQRPADALPLYLASHGVQGKLSLKYNESALPIRPTDIVKVSLNGW
jgi:hypothetical protein